MASCYLSMTNIKILFKYNIFIPKMLSYFGWHSFEFKSQNCSIVKLGLIPNHTIFLVYFSKLTPRKINLYTFISFWFLYILVLTVRLIICSHVKD